MLSFFQRRKQRRVADAVAIEKGRQAVAAMSDDAVAIVDSLCADRRERFLMVLDQRLTAIERVDGVSFNEQARIELQVMWENWNDRKSEQEAEAWAIFEKKWCGVLAQLGGEDAIMEIISTRVAEHSVELFSHGLENSVEAIERDEKQNQGK